MVVARVPVEINRSPFSAFVHAWGLASNAAHFMGLVGA